MSNDQSKHEGFSSLLAATRAGLSRFPAVGLYTALAFVLGTIDGVILGSALFTAPNNATLFSAGVKGCLMGAAVSLVASLALERRAGSSQPSSLRAWLPLAISLPFAAAALLVCFFNGKSVFLTDYVYYGVFAACLCAVYCLLAHGGDSTLFAHLLKSLVFAWFVSLLLFCGLALCIAALSALVLNGSWSTSALISMSYLSFDVVFVNLFCSYLPRTGETPVLPHSYQVVMARVLLPVYLALIAVLYVYIIKIIVTWSMPSGEMNWYGSFALLAFAVLWMGLRTHESPLVQRFVRWGWALLVPVTIVQAIGVWIRLNAYGITPLRYLALALLCLGIFALILAAVRAQPAVLFAVAGVVVLAITVSPLSALDVSTYDQQHRLNAALTQAGMIDHGIIVPSSGDVDEDTAVRIAGSYDYLVGADLGWYQPPEVAYLKGIGKEKSFSAVMGFSKPGSGFSRSGDSGSTGSTESAKTYLRFTTEGSSMNVAGFSRSYRLEQDFTLASAANHLKKTWSDGTVLDVDIGDWLERLRAAHEGASGTLSLSAADATFDCGDGREFVAEKITLTIQNDKVVSVNIKGNLLVP